MNILVVGTGYVGLVTGACFAEMGVRVICVDIDAKKIKNLQKGIIPIYEPGLETIVEKSIQSGNLRFSTDLKSCLEESEILFNAVGTPSSEEGSADLAAVFEVAKSTGQYINKHILFVTKSTVPIGTAEKVRQIIQAELDARGKDISFDVASNPEFLKEGAAVKDFMSPDRVVVGVDTERAKEMMTRLYRPFMLNNFRVIFMDIPSAEMTKYAANAMLATRISFMNEIANLCEKVGADVNMVRKGIGSDSRIGMKFLYPGIGYGGSCFPKDIKALLHTGREMNNELQVIEAVERVNNKQKKILFEKLSRYYQHNLSGKTIAIWGLSFKPETDDMREAPSIVITDLLIEAGCKVQAFDPVAMEEAKKCLHPSIQYFDTIYDVAEGADAILLLTEWKEFRLPNWDDLLKRIKVPVLFDGRNIFEREDVESRGFSYFCIGKE